MRSLFGSCLAVSILAGVALPAWGSEESGVSAEQALARLMEGNARFTAGRMKHANQSACRREVIATGQRPYAIILGCADSRVPPELVFDEGLGDLFVVRVAGNVADADGIGSIEYAVEHLGVKLVVVLGHERCGAVQAAVKGGEAPGHISMLVAALRPAVKAAGHLPGDAVHNTVQVNAMLTRDQLRNSPPILKELAESGKIKIVAARYSLDSGQVEILP
jgi:carbonic anhydrase